MKMTINLGSIEIKIDSIEQEAAVFLADYLMCEDSTERAFVRGDNKLTYIRPRYVRAIVLEAQNEDDTDRIDNLIDSEVYVG